MTYATTNFEVARSNGLDGDTFTRNVPDALTDGPRTDFGTKLIYPFFLKKKAGIKIENFLQYQIINQIMSFYKRQNS